MYWYAICRMSNTINFQANVVNLIKFTPIHKKKMNVPKFPLALSFIDKIIFLAQFTLIYIEKKIIWSMKKHHINMIRKEQELLR